MFEILDFFGRTKKVLEYVRSIISADFFLSVTFAFSSIHMLPPNSVKGDY